MGIGVTAPLFHLQPGRLDQAAAGSALVLDGPEGHHAATVMRMSPGEQIQLSDTRHRRVSGVVLSAASGELSIEVQQVEDEPPVLPRLVLVQALAKDKRDLQAAESATELGVDEIIPWEAARSVARWKLGRETKKHAEWENMVRTAAKQTRRTAIPEVHSLHTTAQYLKLLEDPSAPGRAVLVLHELERRSLAEALWQLGLLDHGSRWVPEAGIDQLHIVVGPEGGISDRERDQLIALGAKPALLGKNVLRSSTAGPAAIAAIQLLRGDWGTLGAR